MDFKTRFAPSPTGILHIGGVRTALFNYLFAKHHGGEFFLRIEDTDQSRFDPSAEQYILDSLKWLGLSFDDNPIKQSDRKHLYQMFAHDLIVLGKAYYAYDTIEELKSVEGYDRTKMRNSLTTDQHTEPYTIRMLIPKDQTVIVNDLIRGEVSYQTNDLDDKIILKADGMPTYHLASVVDDHLMDISHVIRGEEWLPSTAHHILLYQLFNWSLPEFAHLPLILNPNGKGKLSKRNKIALPVDPLAYRDLQYEPEAIINFLALLGWHPEGTQEIFSLEELIQKFNLEQITKSGAIFDVEKLKWFNQQYLRQKSGFEIACRYPKYSSLYISKIFDFLKERLETSADLDHVGYYFFEDIQYKDVDHNYNHILEKIISLPNAIDLSKKVNEIIEQECATRKEIFPLIRTILTGQPKGPDIFQIIDLLGFNCFVQRTKAYMDSRNSNVSENACLSQ